MKTFFEYCDNAELNGIVAELSAQVVDNDLNPQEIIDYVLESLIIQTEDVELRDGFMYLLAEIDTTQPAATPQVQPSQFGNFMGKLGNAAGGFVNAFGRFKDAYKGRRAERSNSIQQAQQLFQQLAQVIQQTPAANKLLPVLQQLHQVLNDPAMGQSAAEPTANPAAPAAPAAPPTTATEPSAAATAPITGATDPAAPAQAQAVTKDQVAKRAYELAQSRGAMNQPHDPEAAKRDWEKTAGELGYQGEGCMEFIANMSEIYMQRVLGGIIEDV